MSRLVTGVCRSIAVSAVTLLALGAPSLADVGDVLGEQKINDTVGGFTGVLDDADFFGWTVATLGDLDGDGVDELAVGAPADDDGGSNTGAVWILFLNTDGTVRAHQKISALEGGLSGPLAVGAQFGIQVAGLGDHDGDGVGDLVVGNPGDPDGGSARGAVWVLFLNADGTVKAEQKISATQGGFAGALDAGDKFGGGLRGLADLDGDGVGELAVGAPGDDDGLSGAGAVWVLFLDVDGSVKSHQKVSRTAGGFTGALSSADQFGASIAALGDLDGNGVAEIAVSAPSDDDGGANTGAVWVLFLNADGTVGGTTKISALSGGFTGDLDAGDTFGNDVAGVGDLDGDGISDLLVGSPGDDDGLSGAGSVWLLFLNANGTVGSSAKISATEGQFVGPLSALNFFGYGVSPAGDVDGNGSVDLAVGAPPDGANRGAVWILFLVACGNGALDGSEECDDGNTTDGDGCDSNCTVTSCGNGIVTDGEKCDDGNNESGDGCQSDCRLPFCGDGFPDPGEECDDGGESAACDVDCTFASCGDGATNMAAGEECDDGGTIDCDGCSASCLVRACGDGIVDPDCEECDDGGESAECNVDCTIAACGDGLSNRAAGEECDDGGTADGDGCSALCLYEDRDADGVPDFFDNCVDVANSVQTDSDYTYDREDSVQTGSSVSSTRLADFDGDGDDDLVATSTTGSTVWFENVDGAGIFGDLQEIGPLRAIEAEAADVDGDGNLDIVVAGRPRIVWYRNEGVGDFGPEIVISDPSVGPLDVTVADVDGDGDLDVLAAFFNQHEVLWFENLDSAGGSWLEHPVVELAGGFRAARTGDVDGDGDLDVVFAESIYGWIENLDGDGTFGMPRTISEDSLLTGKNIATVSDVDLDGDIDLVAFGLDGIEWYKNTDAGGTFGPAIPIAAPDETDLVISSDLDLDGDPDLVLVSADSEFIGWVVNVTANGVTTFSDGPFYQEFPGSSIRDYVAAGDLDADPAVELVGGLNSTIYVLDATADLLGDACDNCPSVANADQLDSDQDAVGNVCDNCVDVANEGQSDLDMDTVGDACDPCPLAADDDIDMDGVCGDVDNCRGIRNGDQTDQDQDGVGNACDNCVEVANVDQVNLDYGDFGTRRSLPSIAESVQSIDGADFDGDGDLDVVSAEAEVAWHENLDGAGDFGLSRVVALLPAAPWVVLAVDIDGDGDPDVVSAAEETVYWHENEDGAGAFAPPVTIAVVEELQSILTADLDGDGDPDVAAAGSLTFGIRWFENVDGEGTFDSQPTTVATSVPFRDLQAADLDTDGDVDLVALHYPGSTFAWFRNAGDGSFSEGGIATGPQNATRLRAGDIDGDGDADVCVSSGRVYCALNLDGDGTFDEARRATDGEVRPFALQDVDLDGFVDVLGQSGSSIVWYANENRRGDFGPRREIDLALAVDVRTADLDGDGDPDVLVAIEGEDRIAWYPNFGDSAGDACDNCPLAGNTTQSDFDGDDLGDACDNCPEDANAEQENQDGDGLGDVCDACPGDPVDDVDGDGVCGDVDRCPLVFDDGTTDGDGDGIGDACDNCPTVANSEQSDTDLLTFSAERVVSSLAGHVPRVETGDLDGDGDLDVVSSGYFNAINWHPNADGLGTFAPMRPIAEPQGVDVIEVADLDGDGDADVLQSGDTSTWYENDSFGNFGTEHAAPPGAFLARDIDGDGAVDVLSRGGGLLSWHRNLGGGVFGDPRPIGPGHSEVIVGDLDSDGDPDVLETSGIPTWFENLDGLGSFSLPAVLHGDDLNGARIIDLDSDGDPDIVALEDSDRLLWFRNESGSGDFGAAVEIPHDLFLLGYLLASDLDRDGDADLLIGDSSGSSDAGWIENLGSATFAEYVDLPNFPFVPSWEADLDGDGVLDLGRRGSKLGWVQIRSDFLGDACDGCPFDGDTEVDSDVDGDGFGAPCDNCGTVANADQADGDLDGIGDACDVCPADPGDDADVDGLCGDVDNCPYTANADQSDQDTDLAGDACDNCGIDGNPDQQNSDAGSFDTPAVIGLDPDDITAVEAADVDGDGDLDVVATGDTTFWMENLGGAVFGPERVISASSGLGALATADLDGDLDLDVLVGWPQVGWYENLDGLGTFGSFRLIYGGSGPEIFGEDLDGDGDPDIVLAAGSQGGLWLENLGADTYAEPRVWTLRRPRQLRVADLDGDSDLDLLATVENDLFWWENLDGTGAFGTDITIDLLDLLWAPTAVVDLDGDGDLDVLADDRYDLVWYENVDGQGSFGPRTSIVQPAATRDFLAGDIDADGDPDLVWTGAVGMFASVNLGGALEFGAARGVALLFSSDFGLHDLDGDGYLDILASDDEAVVWLRNDTDLLGDVCDNCTDDANQDQLDTDGDSLGDVCDSCPSGFDPTNSDLDGDTLGDVCDNCDLIPNLDQSDLDLDGSGDACDNCLDVANTDQLDTDADTLGDSCDECPNIPNPGQEQTVACLDTVADGGFCLETRIDLIDPVGSGTIRVGERGATAPTSMTLEVWTAHCTAAITEITFELNGVEIGVVEYGPEVPCGCGGALSSLVVDDAALLASAWISGADNVIRISRPASDSSPFAWGRVRAETAEQEETFCVYDVDGGDCDVNSVCDAGFLLSDAFSVESSVGDPFESFVTLVEVPYTDGELPPSIDLSGIPDGTLEICVTDLADDLDCVQFVKQGENQIAINNSPCPPVAIAYAALSGECASVAGVEIDLDGHDSTDPNSTAGTNDDIVLFEWFEDYGTEDETYLGEGERLTVMLSVGIHVLTLRVTDSTGNTAMDPTGVRYPAPCWRKLDAIDVLVEKDGAAARLTWDEVPDADSYTVVRGLLTELGEANIATDLGAVACLPGKPASDPTTRVDLHSPLPGTAFFYVVKHVGATEGVYGAGRSGLPRIPRSGDCAGVP